MKAVAIAVLSLMALPAAGQGGAGRCIDLRTDLTRYYGCLNEDLRRLVPSAAARAQPAAPYSAASPGYQVGGFNVAATRQMLGRNFGVSSRPDRPVRTAGPSALFQGR